MYLFKVSNTQSMQSHFKTKGGVHIKLDNHGGLNVPIWR